jgi:histo-blood group ABO system transferase
MKIGLLIIATNKYISFLEPLIKSADSHFLLDMDITYFIFSNHDIKINTGRKFINIAIEHKGWPFMTLGRYDIFTKNHNHLTKMDYLFYCDVDMLFVSPVAGEIIGDLVVTQHPGYYGRRGTPETNPKSLACIRPYEQMQYFAGGFNGGSSVEFLKMSKRLSDNILHDMNNGIIAIWHDESHLNRYMVDNPPSIILNPSYCCPENWIDCPFGRKLLALDKNHLEIRS